MTFATTKRVFERPMGQGAGVSLVGNATATGASPLSLTVPGSAAEGDIAVMGFISINSIPNASGPSGGSAWTEVVYQDVNSSDYHAIWWKVLGGSEPGSWSLTHSAGTDIAAAVSVFRATGVNDLYGFSFREETLQPGWAEGHPQGFQVLVYMCIDHTNLILPSGVSVSTAVDYHSASPNDCQVGMVYRDTTWSGDAIPIRCGGSDGSTYTGSANMVFYPS